MMVMMKKEMIEEIGLIVGLIMIQFVYAGNTVLMSYLMSIGISPLSLVIFTSFATFLVLSPLAFFFERTKWPRKFTLKLCIQLVLISFAGVTLFQSFFLKGIELTSPAIATAMPNLAPGFIFIIACISSVDYFDKEKIIGVIYLLAGVVVLSSNVVLQAATLGDFPAPMSLCAITSLIGVFITMFVQLVQDHKVQTGGPLISVRELFAYSLLTGIVSGACISFNNWAMKKRGPVLVSMFSPIATVLSIIFSVITLGDTISLGSLAGMSLMFTSLYFVLWAKGKEDLTIIDNLRSESDPEKPLLH